MYAIVEIAGQQFKVVKDQKVFVNRLQTEEGKKVSFDNVLLLGDGDKVTVGAPAIDGAQVGAKVLKHLKGDKVIVFKKKRRKGYRVKNGHRQSLTEIIIENIAASGSKPAKKAAPKKEAKKEEPKVEDSSTRQIFRKKLREGDLDEKEIEIEAAAAKFSLLDNEHMLAIKNELEVLNGHRMVNMYQPPPGKLSMRFAKLVPFGLRSVIGASVVVSVLAFLLSHVNLIPLLGDWLTALLEEIQHTQHRY